MGYIQLKNVRAVGDKLLEQTSGLKNINEEIKEIENSLRSTSYVEEVLHFIDQCEAELEEEILTMKQMGDCILDISQIYDQTESKIADMYDLEYVQYPKTQYGISKITGLDQYKDLLAFRKTGGSDGRLY